MARNQMVSMQNSTITSKIFHNKIGKGKGKGMMGKVDMLLVVHKEEIRGGKDQK